MRDRIKEHPCFDHEAHFKYARIHLPVAPRCNIRCKFCKRGIGSSEIRPGVSERVISPKEAIRLLRKEIDRGIPIKVVAIAGPGEPLANPETFETLSLIKDEFPWLIRCIATNGLYLPEKIDLLLEIGIDTLTITICSVSPDIGERIYEYVKIDGRIIRGREGADILIRRQIEGLRAAVDSGIEVKINTVLIPGINMDHAVQIAKLSKRFGARIMNIMPLIPLGDFSHMRRPTKEELSHVQDLCALYIDQFRLCKQCRADACGIPGGEDGKISF